MIVHAPFKIGAGTAQEMVLAKSFQKPLIAIIPMNTHHRRSNVVFHEVTIEDWIHPFLVVASDYIAENIEEAIVWVQEFFKKPTPTKTLAVFDKTIASFERELPDTVKSYRKQGW